jgi:uncharacterized MAPEG superfamily protein
MQHAHFTFAYGCVLIAALMPIACAGIAKSGMLGKPRRKGGYDNYDPRAWLARQTDWRARANAAQHNCFEALPFFRGAIVIAHQLGAYQMSVDLLAFFYVLLRILYIMVYISDMAKIRSILWTAAFVINIVILFIGYR